MQDQLTDILGNFQTLSLKEIECVKLMTRSDRKYLCHISQLNGLLDKANKGFRVLRINEHLIQGYESLYLDTPGHRMFLDHHNGKLNRYKIRIREYKTTGEFFLEIKKKDNHLNTEKKRMSVPPGQNFLIHDQAAFISRHSPYNPTDLVPALSSAFQRITLVNNDIFERITIDIHPSWQRGDQRIELPHVVIMEVKSTKGSSSEGFSCLLRDARIPTKRLSKYCTGMTLLFPEIKHNRFKEKLLHLNKLENNFVYVE
jgi:hypothetical protein